MKLIKKINNNFAVAVDGNNEEMIVYGKGVGFPSMPYELEDLSKVERTYYLKDEQAIDILQTISEDVLKVSTEIYDLCVEKIKVTFNENMPFTLADHIAFAIKRHKENITFNQPTLYDLIQMYPKEAEIAQSSVNLINTKLDTNLPDSESNGILLNIINNEVLYTKDIQVINSDAIIENISLIIETELEVSINRKSNNYSRYATHINYLLQRLSNDEEIFSSNIERFDSVSSMYAKEYLASIKIKKYLETIFNRQIVKEELVYLILHINRLTTREGL